MLGPSQDDLVWKSIDSTDDGRAPAFSCRLGARNSEGLLSATCVPKATSHASDAADSCLGASRIAGRVATAVISMIGARFWLYVQPLILTVIRGGNLQAMALASHRFHTHLTCIGCEGTGQVHRQHARLIQMPRASPHMRR